MQAVGAIREQRNRFELGQKIAGTSRCDSIDSLLVVSLQVTQVSFFSAAAGLELVIEKEMTNYVWRGSGPAAQSRELSVCGLAEFEGLGLSRSRFITSKYSERSVETRPGWLSKYAIKLRSW